MVNLCSVLLRLPENRKSPNLNSSWAVLKGPGFPGPGMFTGRQSTTAYC